MQYTDQKLYELCRKYGEQARLWRQKFLGLLPEVYSRRLYEKKGFSSIFEFAKKLVGISEEQVRVVLNLEKKFEDKPVLKNLLVNGEVSANKLARVASIATPQNQEFLAAQSKLLSQSALETLVRDVRNTQNADAGFEDENGFQDQLFDGESLRAHSNLPSNLESSSGRQTLQVNQESLNERHTLSTGVELEHEQQSSNLNSGLSGRQSSSDLFESIKLLDHFSPEVQQKLRELVEKGIDINDLLLEFLQKREDEIVAEKERLSAEAKPTDSRYVRVAVKKVLVKEHGTKCSKAGCTKLSVETHHAQRYGLGKIHDPKYMAPFCKEHHQIAHSIDVAYQARRDRALVFAH